MKRIPDGLYFLPVTLTLSGICIADGWSVACAVAGIAVTLNLFLILFQLLAERHGVQGDPATAIQISAHETAPVKPLLQRSASGGVRSTVDSDNATPLQSPFSIEQIRERIARGEA